MSRRRPATRRVNPPAGLIMADMERPVDSLTRDPRRHFFGYYDKCPWDSTGRYALALETDFADCP